MSQLSMMSSSGDIGTAVFSPCRTWRYTLTRIWDPKGTPITFIGLNPSTADETVNDPTIRRCIGFARRWGYGRMIMLNLFGFRATDPRDMKKAPDPVGPDNDVWIRRLAEGIETIAVWGAHGHWLERDHQVLDLVGPVKCLGTTKEGFPKHPLYLRGDVVPEPYM